MEYKVSVVDGSVDDDECEPIIELTMDAIPAVGDHVTIGDNTFIVQQRRFAFAENRRNPTKCNAWLYCGPGNRLATKS